MNLPPLGLRPRLFALEDRYLEVRAAIVRYIDAEHPIPADWWEEYYELIAKIRQLRTEGI